MIWGLAVGLTMSTRWIPVHRACVAASHGLLADTIFILVLLTMLTG
jgi:hypothetical protein